MSIIPVIYKPHTPDAQRLARELAPWLKAKGIEAPLFQAEHSPAPAGPVAALKLPAQAELVVVLGGDGTMLGAVREVVLAGLQHVPILGVNVGGLGFLTALTPQELFPALEQVLRGDFTAPSRLMVQAQLQRGPDLLGRFIALNDLVINKAALARIVELNLKVDDQPVTSFRADGLIISTPTGSTAYNLSAGGPICHPSLACLVVAPICSFALSNRPLLLNPNMTLCVTLGLRSRDTTLTCDGQVGVELQPGDQVLVSRAPETVRLIQSPSRDYFNILRTKLHWG